VRERRSDAGVRRIGLTGGIATGKTWVRARFDDLGVPTIDADVLAREVVAPGTPGLAAVVNRFGREMLTVAGALDRQKLGRIVFTDAAARRALEGIIHPEVRQSIDQWFDALDPQVHRWAIADIPLLYETGRDRDFDAVIVVACEPETQVRRIVARDALTEQEARQRMAAQLPIEDKAARADYVIRTDGTLDETDDQVNALWADLNR
jgi:dephospho-CoA kinase